MKPWHENARFHVFCDCDVFVEDGGYLYVENQPYDYNGSYACCDYRQDRNSDGTLFYTRGEYAPAANDYIRTLDKAPWDIARDVIACALDDMIEHETAEFKDVIKDAKRCLVEDATKDKKFYF